jgi:hypothetical protein
MMRDKSGHFTGGLTNPSHSRNIFCLVIFACAGFLPVSASSQIIGDIGGNINLEAVSQGTTNKGFGLSALRYEDKQRMKRLRERYWELNPRRKGVVTIYDVDTSTEDKPTIEEILEGASEEFGLETDAQ